VSYLSEVGSNQLRNSPIEIIGLIDQLIEAFDESTVGLRQDTEIFIARAIDIANCIQRSGESASIENVIGCIQQMKALTLNQRNCEQARYEKISKRVSLIRRYLEEAKTEASLDVLTQVADLKNFNCTFQRRIAAHEKSGAPLTIAFFDLDNCRRINESFGRPVGDKILASIALELGRNIRERDFLARCSGDEFAVLSSGMKLENAAKRFSKLLQRFETIQCRSNGMDGPIASFTVSCGIAEYAIGESAEELVNRAQNALYDARKLGKNSMATRLKFLLRTGTDNTKLLVK
jgi:diguanylate cyclase